ncbi:restriction endonuclease [Nocardiopsis baichengensis]|uniref:restriction endonuclease n=1 Tax=Nocardiopsis baichengensis TaxID=280240 RepID=UPI000345D0E9|nr:hypothetical protein [Nocardiopsis baichengensis]
MASQHYEQFVANLDYARNMVVGGRALAGIRGAAANYGDLQQAHPEDLFRAAWSQGVSALDHWLHEEIAEHAVALLTSPERPLPRQLEKLSLRDSIAERRSGDSEVTALSEAVKDAIRYVTYQRSRKISEGLKLVTDRSSDEIWERVGKSENLSIERARTKQDAIVDRRNRIAHRADLADDGTRSPMSAGEAQEALRWIAHVADRLRGIFPARGIPRRAWVVRAGRRDVSESWFLDGRRVGGGFNEIPDLTPVDSRERLREVIAEARDGVTEGFIGNFAGQLWRLRELMSVGDLVVLPVKSKNEIAIARILGDYAYDSGAPENQRHHRRVEWLRTGIPQEALGADLQNSLQAITTIFELYDNDAARRITELAASGTDPGPREAAD